MWWGNAAAGPFLREATQKEHQIPRHSLLWLAEHTQLAGLAGQQDHGTAHSTAHRQKMFGDRNTRASPGSRQLEQKGSDRARTAEQLCQDTWGQGKEESTQTQGQGPAVTCNGTDHFLTRNPFFKSKYYNNQKKPWRRRLLLQFLATPLQQGGVDGRELGPDLAGNTPLENFILSVNLFEPIKQHVINNYSLFSV